MAKTFSLQKWVRLASSLFLLGGAVTLIIAMRAPPDQDLLAITLAQRALWALGIGVGIAFSHWMISRLSRGRFQGQAYRG